MLRKFIRITKKNMSLYSNNLVETIKIKLRFKINYKPWIVNVKNWKEN